MKLKVKMTHPDAMLPVYASAGAACFDLHAADLVRSSGKTAVYDTGLAFEIPEGYAVKIYSRSGHGFNHDIRLANCTGIIDSDFRGSIKVKLVTDGRLQPIFATGDRIAQAELVKVLQVGFEEVDELNDTQRGAGGFGSTGS